METKEKTTRRLRPLLPLLPPVLLSLLFYLFRGRQALMDGWVIHVMTPAEQLLGRLSAPLPFSLAEALVTVFLTACALCLIRGTVLAVRLHAPHELGRRLVCLLCALLWVWTGYCWLWSAGYYSASFAEKSGLETRPYTVSTLAQVTLYFACQAADLSTQMVRDSEGHFAEDLDDCFRRGVSVYEELEQKLRSNKFTLADYYDQLVQLKGMGSVQDLLGMMPGMGNLKNVQVDEGALGRTEAIIQSMTPYERENPNCLNHSRKRRIAAGSGVKVEEVNKMLKSFEMMQTLMRQMNGSGKRKKKNRGFGSLPNLPGMGGMGLPKF